MAEKILNTRIALKIDTLERWQRSTTVLKNGELAIATLIAPNDDGNVTSPVGGVVLKEPVCMLKIGDGHKTFSELGWNVYARASDVIAAAKSETELTSFINNVIASNNTITGLSAAIQTLNGTETDDGSVAKAIKDAIAALNLAETYVAKESEKSLVSDTEIARLAAMSDGANKVENSETNGNIKIDGAEVVVYTHPEHTSNDISDFSTAVAAVKVNEATKATQDGDGNVITTTYAKAANTYTKDETHTAIQNAIDEIPEQTNYTVTITSATENLENNIAKRYTFTQNGREIGSIDLAKDLVVTNGSVKEVTEADKPYSGAVVGEKYIELVIANQINPIYVPAKDLVDIYTAKVDATEVQVAISNTNEISATLVDGSVKEAKLDSAVTAKLNKTWEEVGVAKGLVDAAVGSLETYTDNAIEALALGTMSKEAADDYVKKSDAAGYDDILTTTTAQTLYATIEQGQAADTAVQNVTSAVEGGYSGLKVTRAENSNDVNIEVDDTITWVFDCGDSGAAEET